MSRNAGNGEGDSIPKTWEWYGEAIKWFIAIAAGLLAFGFDQASDGKLESWWTIYLIGALFLGFSVIAGLYAYLQLLGAATQKEQDASKAGEVKSPANVSDVSQHHHVQPINPKPKPKPNRFLHRTGRAYMACVGALAFGVVFSSIAFLGAIWPEDKLKPVIPLSLIKSQGDALPFVVRHTEKGTDVMTETASGKLQWTTIALPKANADAGQSK